MSFLPTLGNALLATIFPQPCRSCGGEPPDLRDGVACQACWRQIESLRATASLCLRCGEWRLPSGSEEAPPPLCGRCDELSISIARSCGPHLGALRESVVRLKTRPELPPTLRRLLAETMDAFPVDHFDAIIPVPLHQSRLTERSFNQAEIIATAIAKLTHLPVETTCVVRQRPTERHRLGMGQRERKRSLAGAFTVRAPRLITGRRLILVDDVMTTGTTASEIARTLLAHGADEVALITISRAAPRNTHQGDHSGVSDGSDRS